MATDISTACTVEYDKDTGCGIMTWRGYATSAQLRAAYNNFLKLVQDCGVNKGLSDNRGMTMLSLEDQEWINKDFLPRLLKTGFKYSAVIVPASHFARIGVENVVQNIQQDEIQVRYFPTVDKAKEWLRSVD